MSVVVIGAGLGGLRSVEALRRCGWTEPITLVSAEHHRPYDRPPLTKQVLRGERDSTTLQPELDTLEVRVLQGRTAQALDVDARSVQLDDGDTLGYDHLVLAVGGRPRMLPGVEPGPGLHVVRTIEDALALRAAAAAAGRVAVVGGGFIGCETAASLRSSEIAVDLVEVLAQPLVRVLGPTGATIVADLLAAHGVRLHLNVGVAQVLGDEHVSGLLLSDGTTIDASEVVLGLGIVPDLDWLSGSGLTIDDGIVCDSAGRTSAPGVYAVGDCARWTHPLAGHPHRVEHWTTTGEQASVVASVITGDDTANLDTVPYFWSDIFDVKIQALGFVDPMDEVTVLSPGGRRVLLYSREGYLRSAVGFSAARHIMGLRELIARQAPIGEAQALLDI